jgi:cobalt-zinc-cadmium efflux system protein
MSGHDHRTEPHSHGGHHHNNDHGEAAHRDVGHEHEYPDSGRLLGWALVLTTAFMAVEFPGGLWSRSLALLADAGHMLTDAAALALAWAATRIAARPADHRRSFGYQRLRVLATFVNGCALLFVVAWIAFEAVQRLFEPVPVNPTPMLAIGALGLAVNVIVFLMLRQGHAHDMNVAAATLHVLGDLLGSLAAVVAAAVILWSGWLAIDPLLSLAVSALIVRSALALVRRSAHILMEGSPDWLDQGELRRILEQRIPAIRDVHHVHAWLVGPQETLLTMHATVNDGSDHTAVLRDAKAVLAERFGITHATIQIEAAGCVDEDCGQRNRKR